MSSGNPRGPPTTQGTSDPGNEVAANGILSADGADLFRFEAKAGETVILTVIAGRAGSPLDPILRIRNSNHISLTMSAGFKERDRKIEFVPPHNGTYYVELGDAEGKSGNEFRYRLDFKRK